MFEIIEDFKINAVSKAIQLTFIDLYKDKQQESIQHIAMAIGKKLINS